MDAKMFRYQQEKDLATIKEWAARQGLASHGGEGQCDINVMGTNMSAILAELIRKVDSLERLHGVVR